MSKLNEARDRLYSLGGCSEAAGEGDPLHLAIFALIAHVEEHDRLQRYHEEERDRRIDNLADRMDVIEHIQDNFANPLALLLSLVGDGAISMSRGAELAGMTLGEFRDEAKRRAK